MVQSSAEGGVIGGGGGATIARAMPGRKNSRPDQGIGVGMTCLPQDSQARPRHEGWDAILTGWRPGLQAGRRLLFCSFLFVLFYVSLVCCCGCDHVTRVSPVCGVVSLT